MPRRTSSTGKCNLCGKTFAKAAMTRHMPKCRAEHPYLKGKPRKTFRLIAEGRNLPEYWLQIEMPAEATLLTLDAFLRDIWLECCGHLSAFTIDDVRYELDTGGIDGMWTELFGPWEPPKSMNAKLSAVLRPGLKFFHEYDFGTTTELTVRVLAEQEGSIPKNAVDILARNDPPPVTCEKCGQPAVWVCSNCIYDNGGWLCDAHTRKHKCGEEMLLPVVNSPRVGMCGYTGGMEA